MQNGAAATASPRGESVINRRRTPRAAGRRVVGLNRTWSTEQPQSSGGAGAPVSQSAVVLVRWVKRAKLCGSLRLGRGSAGGPERLDQPGSARVAWCRQTWTGRSCLEIIEGWRPSGQRDALISAVASVTTETVNRWRWEVITAEGREGLVTEGDGSAQGEENAECPIVSHVRWS